MFENSGGPEVLVLQGDVTANTADDIVNAASSHLTHGGGLAGAIVRKGGASIQSESSDWVDRHGSVTVGSAMSTSSGSLLCKSVIHTVGPNVCWTQFELAKREEITLGGCCKSRMETRKAPAVSDVIQCCWEIHIARRGGNKSIKIGYIDTTPIPDFSFKTKLSQEEFVKIRLRS
ncbi:hypothetical protein BBJ28_00026598 [Nothophytophthora sp. Chile5]|nr:hypothetical protein BBJ28_00026598 [Nothophytophthora sp. Chile5]